MKLRFSNGSVRLRLNRREVNVLAAGAALEEEVIFPGGGRLSYALTASAEPAGAAFRDGAIRISAPSNEVMRWAESSTCLGVYLELPAEGRVLKVAIEKDLACVDGPEEEQDPDAFPRDETTYCLPISR